MKQKIAQEERPDPMKEAFQTFIKDYARRTGTADLPPQKIEELSVQFQSWWTERTSSR